MAVACTWNLTGAELDGAAGSPLLAGAGVVDVKGLVGWASVAPGLEAVERLGLDQNAAAELDQHVLALRWRRGDCVWCARRRRGSWSVQESAACYVSTARSWRPRRCLRTRVPSRVPPPPPPPLARMETRRLETVTAAKTTNQLQ